jgi:hypothetical protein
VAALLQHIHDVELMFGEYLGETVGVLDGVSQLRRLLMLGIAEPAGIEDVGAHP